MGKKIIPWRLFVVLAALAWIFILGPTVADDIVTNIPVGCYACRAITSFAALVFSGMCIGLLAMANLARLLHISHS